MTEQLSLVPVPSAAGRRRGRAPTADVPLAATDPVGRVLIDTPLAHLDRPFDYLVPAELDEDAQPGCRVRVRFSGRQHDGILLERVAEPDHAGRLSTLGSVVSPEPVLTPEVAAELRLVADHYGGTAADVLRLAVPPRHARAERSVPPPGPFELDGLAALVPPAPSTATEAAPHGPWAAYPAGGALLRRLQDGQAPPASWLALPRQPPGADWPDALAQAVVATLSAGRGSVVIVPDRHDVDRVLAPLTEALGEHADTVVRLTADLGPEARYQAFLRVLRGHARVVVGNRSAVFAPVHDLGLLACWDEADDLHQEPRAPYPHVREVLRIRAQHEGAALLLGGHTRSVTAQQWVEEGWLAPVVASAATVRRCAPPVVVAGEGWQEARDEGARTARIPSVAWRALREGLEDGPVLVQVPRRGYVVALACQDCRTPVRCGHCEGPVGAPARDAPPTCRWCHRGVDPGAACRECGSRRLRATGLGERRTAEELGRAFPGTRVITSGGEHVLAQVGNEPALVVATPGAEPWCPSGYRAVALLDGWRLLERASLDAGPEALRRWARALALLRPEGPAAQPTAPAGVQRTAPAAGGRRAQAVLCGVPPHAGLPAVEALIRWDPGWLAAQELAERRSLGLPPARRLATLTGPTAAVGEVAQELAALGHEVLGGPGSRPRALGAGDLSVPASEEPPASVAVREGAHDAPPLPEAVHAVRAGRSARKAQDAVRIVLDATEPGGL